MPEVMTVVRADHPGLDIQLSELRIADPCRPLREDEVDLALTRFPVNEPGITTGPVVLSEPRVLAVSARHPYARRASVSLEDLARDHTFRPAGVGHRPSDCGRASDRTPTAVRRRPALAVPLSATASGWYHN
ncbi:LysR substrate-binding domain-containing protein [Nonomuraea sp. NPDC004186]